MSAVRARREPASFRRCVVSEVEELSPRMLMIRLVGSELVGFTVDKPTASVRLLVPPSGEAELVLPTWNGNEFLDADGGRPTLRTFTPLRVDAGAGSLDLEIVRHGGGSVSSWAEQASPGDPAAISGPGRGYEVALEAPAFLLAGDETAIPAIAQLLGAIPAEIPVAVHIELTRPDAKLPLGEAANVSVHWHVAAPADAAGTRLIAAVRAAEIAPGTRIWAAGEAASVQAIRKHLFDDRAIPRGHASIRGYWKRRRS